MNNSKHIDKYTSLVTQADHMLLVYENQQEVINTVSSYLINQLNKNYKCICITGDLETIKLVSVLKKLINYEIYTNSGQLCIISPTESYAKSGSFTPKQMIQLLKKEALNAKVEGYEGLAISGEVSWVLDAPKGFEKIVEYEWKINEEVFNNYPISAICRYNKNKFTHAMMIDIIQLHEYIIWNERIHENPFYLPPVSYKTNNIKKYQVEMWLKNISKFTNIKNKFYREIEAQEEKYHQLKLKLVENIIVSITGLLELHDEYTNGHSENVAYLTKEIAKSIGLHPHKVAQAYYCGLVHDIGKTIIPRNILNKKTPLTTKEYSLIKKHPISGYKTLNKSKETAKIAKYVLHHHEWWNGEGYPHQLKKDSIPIISRILCIADAYDAMINNRPYRKALSKERALEELKANAGRQFDPHLTEIFLNMFK